MTAVNGYAFSTLAMRCIRNQILQDIRDNSKKGLTIVSLDEMIFDDNENLTLIDKLADDFDLEESLLNKEEICLLYKAILKLNDDEKLLVKLYLNNFKQKEIAKELNITQPHVSRRLQNVIAKLRNILTREDL